MAVFCHAAFPERIDGGAELTLHFLELFLSTMKAKDPKEHRVMDQVGLSEHFGGSLTF